MLVGTVLLWYLNFEALGAWCWFWCILCGTTTSIDFCVVLYRVVWRVRSVCARNKSHYSVKRKIPATHTIFFFNRSSQNEIICNWTNNRKENYILFYLNLDCFESKVSSYIVISKESYKGMLIENLFTIYLFNRTKEKKTIWIFLLKLCLFYIYFKFKCVLWLYCLMIIIIVHLKAYYIIPLNVWIFQCVINVCAHINWFCYSFFFYTNYH